MTINQCVGCAFRVSKADTCRMFNLRAFSCCYGKMTSLPVPVNLLSDPAFVHSSSRQPVKGSCTTRIHTESTQISETSGQKLETKIIETPISKKGILLKEPPEIDVVTTKQFFDAYSTDALRKFCKLHGTTPIAKTHTKDQLKELAWSLCDGKNDATLQTEECVPDASYLPESTMTNPADDSDDRVIVLRYP